MKTVAIISEYNPFHNGHRYQIEKVREHFGHDTAIIAIMSSNFTQRGEIAIMDKWARAESAVLGGASLVLELPFPYSMSSAEFFAKAGVHIANALGIVDVIAFGSESGDIKLLEKTARNLSSKEIEDEIARLSYKCDNLGYAEIRELAYKNVYGTIPPISSANNILAVEYIKALISSGSTITPFTIRRAGAGYNEENVTDDEIQSATAIRNLLFDNAISAQNFVPKEVFNCILRELNAGAFPCIAEALFPAVAASFTLNFTAGDRDIHDASGGLYNRLKNKCLEATSINSLVELTATKKYTTARIRRGIWYSLLGVTSSDVRVMPEYTQVLAMDKHGQALLKRIKKSSSISVLTKPSDTPSSPIGVKQKELSDKADAISQLSKPAKSPTGSIYKRTPFVKKDV